MIAQQQLQIQNFFQQRKISMFAMSPQTPMVTEIKKEKFDFAHIAESIESEQKVKEECLSPKLSPTLSATAVRPIGPYDQPWWVGSLME